MGLGLKVFVIMVCVAFFFSFAPRPCASNESGCVGFTNYSGAIGAVMGNPLNPGSYYNSIHAQLLLATVVSAAAAIFFPNPFTIFAAFSLFLLNFAVIPYELLTSAASFGFSANDPLILLISGIFGLMFVIAAITWYKGNEW